MTSTIHSTAVVHQDASIGDGAEIGPFCVIDEGVVIGSRTKLQPHVHLMPGTTIGSDGFVGSGARIGGGPQIYPYEDKASSVLIGNGVIIRENVTIHRGSSRGDLKTQIADGCYLMDNSHVGHDCHLARNCILARGATLGGHSELEEGVYVGGLTAVHQRTRIGKFAFIGGVLPLTRDVIPYALVNGNPAKLEGINIKGLARKGLPKERISAIVDGFRKIFLAQEGTLRERARDVRASFSGIPEIEDIVAFIEDSTNRGLCVAY